MDNYQYTDLDRLHRVASSDLEALERGAGRTFLECHELAGVMETTDQSGVLCRVISFCRVRHITRMLMEQVFPDHDIELLAHNRQHDMTFQLPGGIRKRIIFAARDMGGLWPIVDFT